MSTTTLYDPLTLSVTGTLAGRVLPATLSVTGTRPAESHLWCTSRHVAM